MNFLKSKEVALWLSMATVLLVLTPNTASVFHDMSSFDGWLGWSNAIAYSLALEFGIIWFALRSRIVPVAIFMTISAAIHVVYYWDKILQGQYISVVIAISLPLMVYLIAEETRKDAGRIKRNKPATRPSQPVKKLDKKDRIIELIGQGLSDQQIAEMVGMNRSSIYRIRNKAA